jgi:hypothetical protein
VRWQEFLPDTLDDQSREQTSPQWKEENARLTLPGKFSSG